MEDRRMETHRETQERGEREGHGPRETAVGPQRGREGQKGETGHRSASLRHPLTPSPVPGPPTRETSFMWASRSASWGWNPLQGEDPVGGARFPRLPDSGLPLRPGQAGLGSGAVVHGLTREPWASGGSGPRPGVGTELVHGTPPPPRPHCPGSLVPQASLKKWGGIPPLPAHIDDSLLGLRHVRDDPVRDD